MIQIPAAIALILCIVGATNAKDAAGIESEQTVHIGIILYTVVFVALVLLTVGAALGTRVTRRGEPILILAVSFALPFLAVRIIYAILAAFSHKADFNPATGSKTIALCMDTLEEMVVVAVYIVAAIKLEVVPRLPNGERRGTRSTLMHRAGRGDFSTGKLGLFSLANAVGQEMSRHKAATANGAVV
jgi:hypothetical protein